MSDKTLQKDRDDQRGRVEVCFSPNLYPLHKDEHHIAVVIDVLRATTAICTAFHHGVGRIIPLETIEEAREYQRKGYHAAAERKGRIVEGFELGNSPLGFKTDRFRGETVAMTTTNGTQAIKEVADMPEVLIGAFVNLDAICTYLRKREQNVLLLCAGWENRFNLEDTICAGAIADRLINSGHFVSLHDSSISAKYLYRSARDNYFGFLKSSSHRRRLKDLDLGEDIKFSLTPNQTDVIPVLRKGALIRLEEVPEKEKGALATDV